MCLSKVYVRDVIRGRNGSMLPMAFSCGKCPACKQAAADRRSRRIRNHHPKGFYSYFVNLDYSNKYIPYINKSDLYNYAHVDSYRKGSYIPIYRNGTIIGRHYISKSYDSEDFKSLSGIRTLLNRSKEIYKYDRNKISICFTPDIQRFFKRFRKILKSRYKVNIPLTYYYAPEYGPTTQRFHAHLLLWLPSFLRLSQVAYYVRKAWSFSDRLSKRKLIEYARNPASYVASYVNCSSDVSSLLQSEFRLRPTHSLFFGFNEDVFSLQKVLEAFRQGRFKYTTVRNTLDRGAEYIDVYYPKYVVDRYFPRIKGFSRLGRDALFYAYLNPRQYFNLYKLHSPCSYRFVRQIDGSLKKIPGYHCTRFLQRGEFPFIFYGNELEYLANKISRTYEQFYKPLGYNYYDYIDIVISYNDRLATYKYIESQSHYDPFDNILEFFNLQQLLDGYVRNETISKYLTMDDYMRVDPDKLPCEIYRNDALTEKFYSHIKQRKKNAL